MSTLLLPWHCSKTSDPCVSLCEEKSGILPAIMHGRAALMYQGQKGHRNGRCVPWSELLTAEAMVDRYCCRTAFDAHEPMNSWHERDGWIWGVSGLYCTFVYRRFDFICMCLMMSIIARQSLKAFLRVCRVLAMLIGTNQGEASRQQERKAKPQIWSNLVNDNWDIWIP